MLSTQASAENQTLLASIWQAVKKGDAKTLKQLLASVASDKPLALDSYKAKNGNVVFAETALWVAVQNNDYACVFELVTHGADANEVSTYPGSPLRAAVKNGHYNALRAIFDYQKLKFTENTLQAVWWAVHRGDDVVLDHLLALPRDASISLDSYTEGNGSETETALWVAVRNAKNDNLRRKREYSCVLQLVNNGADANATTTSSSGSSSPIAWAIENGKDNITQAILASPQFKFTQNTVQAVWWAVYKKNVPVLKHLLALPRDPSISLDSFTSKNYFRTETALWIALYNDDYACVSELVNNGADVNELSMYGDSPLVNAVRFRSNVLLAILRSPKLKFTQNTLQAVWWAAHKGYRDVVRYLLALPRDPSIAVDDFRVSLNNKPFETALWAALKEKENDCVLELVKQGANPDEKITYPNQSPLEWAQKNGYEQGTQAILDGKKYFLGRSLAKLITEKQNSAAKIFLREHKDLAFFEDQFDGKTVFALALEHEDYQLAALMLNPSLADADLESMKDVAAVLLLVINTENIKALDIILKVYSGDKSDLWDIVLKDKRFLVADFLCKAGIKPKNIDKNTLQVALDSLPLWGARYNEIYNEINFELICKEILRAAPEFEFSQATVKTVFNMIADSRLALATLILSRKTDNTISLDSYRGKSNQKSIVGLAINEEYHDFAELLITKHGAKLEGCGATYYKSLFHFAKRMQNYTELGRVIQESDCEFLKNAQLIENVIMAIKDSKPEIAKNLLAKHNVRDPFAPALWIMENGSTALELAVEKGKGYAELAKMLVDYGADPNRVRELDNQTALSLAVSKEDSSREMVLAILSSERFTATAETARAVYKAIILQREDIAIYIVEKCKTFNITFNNQLWKGKSLFQVALDNDFENLAEQLRPKTNSAVVSAVIASTIYPTTSPANANASANEQELQFFTGKTGALKQSSTSK